MPVWASSTCSVGGHAVGRAGAAGRHVDLAAHRAALAEDLPLGDAAQEPGAGHARACSGSRAARACGRCAPARRRARLAGSVTSAIGHRLRASSGTQHAEVLDVALALVGPPGHDPHAGVHGVDRAGVDRRAPSAVSAPSGRTSAQRERMVERMLRDADRSPTPSVVTSPPGPTSTSSVRSSPVSGSYSTGGTSTRPSLALMPTSTRSRRPVRKAPITGPVVRLNGYSMGRAGQHRRASRASAASTAAWSRRCGTPSRRLIWRASCSAVICRRSSASSSLPSVKRFTPTTTRRPALILRSSS